MGHAAAEQRRIDRHDRRCGDTPATCSAEIGDCMGQAWWGQGLMAEALRAVRDFLFDQVATCV